MKTTSSAAYSFSILILAAIALWSYTVHAANGEAGAAPTSPGVSLALDSFLAQVEGDNQSLKAAKEASEGAGLRSSEAVLVYSPIFSAEFQRANDHKLNSLFPGAYQKIYSNVASVGLSQQTSFGMQAKVSYTLSSFVYVGSQPRFWEGLPRLELSQQVWGGGFGASTRANQEIVEAGARASQYTQSFNARSLRAAAETAYVNLAASRALRLINENSLKRGQDIMDWNTRRYKMSLGEDSDLLQAQANIEVIKLQLQNALDSERIAGREFNRLRNVDGDTASELLSLPEVESATAPARAQFRDDVRAAMEQTRVAQAQAVVGRERNKPTLEVFGSFALNSRSPTGDDAVTKSFKDDYPTSVIGVRFQTPLLIGAQLKAIKGYGKEAVAAEIEKDQKVFNQDVQWKDLVLRLNEAKQRYQIATRLSDIQTKKATTERVRLKRGRTTTYQSLLFDQDLNQAAAAKVQAQAEVLQLLAQMKTFGGA